MRLRDALPDFVVSSHAIKPMALKGYLREVSMAIRLLNARFSKDYLFAVSRKQLYKDLVEVFVPTPVYRSMYYLGPERDVFKRVNNMPVRANTKSFFFKLHTGTLPVKPWLRSKGLFVPWSDNCLICNKEETVEHIFLDCHDARFLWDILQRTLKKELPITAFGIRFLPCAEPDGVPVDMLMLLCMQSVWRTRMAVRNADVDARSAMYYFTENVNYTSEVLKLLSDPPNWLSVLDSLASMKPF